MTCGGTILGDEHILTAGHCCKIVEQMKLGIDVEIGQYNTAKVDKGEFSVWSDTFRIHKDFHAPVDSQPVNDICVIKVKIYSISLYLSQHFYKRYAK